MVSRMAALKVALMELAMAGLKACSEAAVMVDSMVFLKADYLVASLVAPKALEMVDQSDGSWEVQTADSRVCSRVDGMAAWTESEMASWTAASMEDS